ncbi:MAG TPA: hypothetical protein VLS49_14485 [Usitatibacter sp.]|nr:hypothetical protein [Usitatibacter sp.]
MYASQREEWIAALHDHEREIERLTRAVRELGEAAGDRTCGDAGPLDDRVGRQIEYATAQKIRHEISMALLSSRLSG